MAVTIGELQFSNLKAQPFGYDENDTRAGLTAKKWSITGVLTPVEWLDLLGEYDAWRDLRIEDEDSLKSNSVGTTIEFECDGPGGENWQTSCWFSSAPSAEQVGAYLIVSFEVVDANEALQVLLRESELSSTEDLGDYGTVTLGDATLTLIRPMDAYGDGPALELTALGSHYVTGPLVVQKVKDIEGTTDEVGWDAVREWYEEQIVAVPLAESWFPISPPTVAAEVKVIDGVKTTQYTVSIQLGQVI